MTICTFELCLKILEICILPQVFWNRGVLRGQVTSKCIFRHWKFPFFETSSVLYFKDYQNSLKPSHVDGEDEWEISIFWEQSDFSKKILTQTRQTFKVHIFWEGHKILQNLSYVVTVKSTVEISQNFVAFSIWTIHTKSFK